ncbi:adenylosuccinate lyase [Candidatus Daviesbacteria bacterium RIFCSPLOWO2_02_FULL_41_8]|uniref:Adenylosuccinate lyase n=3 Tax=Candidatus Daviesiibacteriota TaxID=1752718 RepID=A0A1F5NMA3_9BACT|nr:MAG: adenylosuccinate lyase [Candidatus Daviesbacteria bacterium RIFCSPHIGHO2_01_FULL_41_23]OGE33343.1 MAG: adenylosuccinate lyase [Candidatus Daviesbacteria bacterium RIFCSPHIGHO2_02_FULL_41_10]OGE78758.1 MAG: adenylosuccinate lyase [Candidatus Daviesbacteria bacterium RIFCSPLOWO2_02_FULL_41_8]
MKNNNYSIYQSPFSWRYGSEKMREIFSEEKKYKLWRKVWVALARAQAKDGLVSKEELADLEKNQDNIDIDRIWEIEKDTRHDVVAAIKEFAEKAKIGGGKIHLGATSMDISDNAETVRMTEALSLIEGDLIKLLKVFGEKINKYADFPCMGYTHLQPAEPTTLGYRFAFYAQDLLLDLELLQFVKKNLKSKGLKGAVGTSAGYVKLLDEKRAKEMEAGVLEELGIEAFEITNQTAPRKIEVILANLLAGIAGSLNKFAFDLRIMQSPGFGEWQEPFGKSQVGSSAMPFKKNPIKAEQICSLARLVVNLSRTAWDNASMMLLERTLDDSANRRVVIPEMFLSVDEILNSATNIVSDITINDKRIMKNLDTYWPFSASETIIIEVVKKGADRQKMHEELREISMKARESIQEGNVNPMEVLISENSAIGQYLKPTEIVQLMDAKNHVGNAKEKALTLAEEIKKITL